MIPSFWSLLSSVSPMGHTGPSPWTDVCLISCCGALVSFFCFSDLSGFVVPIARDWRLVDTFWCSPNCWISCYNQILDKHCSTYSMAPCWLGISVLWSTSSHSHCVFATTSSIIVKNSKIFIIFVLFVFYVCSSTCSERTDRSVSTSTRVLRLRFIVFGAVCVASR